MTPLQVSGEEGKQVPAGAVEAVVSQKVPSNWRERAPMIYDRRVREATHDLELAAPHFLAAFKEEVGRRLKADAKVCREEGKESAAHTLEVAANSILEETARELDAQHPGVKKPAEKLTASEQAPDA